MVAIEDSPTNKRGRDRARPSRKTPAHPPVQHRLNRATIIYLTVCTQGRKPILCRSEVHQLILRVWVAADAWLIGRYVLMPDHIHLFCSPVSRDGHSLKGWLQFWKSRASSAWPWPEEQPIWQRDGWDTQLRDGESYQNKWDYVRQNPVRKGLVVDADSWPFQGEIHDLEWREV